MEQFWSQRSVPVISDSNREIILMIHQFLDETDLKESLHELEQESGLLFDVKYFEALVGEGAWKEVERYLSGFLKVDHNEESRTMFFEIRKQKYLETLDSQDRLKALQILEKELKECASEDQFREMIHLLPMENFRQNEKFSSYGDVTSQRNALINILRRHIEHNPLLHNKFKLPDLEPPSFRKMIERNKIQHEPHWNSNPSPDASTCCTNYAGSSTKGNDDVPVSSTTLTNLNARDVSHPLQGHLSSRPVLFVSTGNSSLMSSINQSHDVPIDDCHLGFVRSPSFSAFLNQPMTSHGDLAMEYQTANSQNSMTPPFTAQPDEVPCSSATHSVNVYSAEDLPKTVVNKLGQTGWTVTSMDFNPQDQNVLLVGLESGQIIIWEVYLRKRLRARPFKVWLKSAHSMRFQNIMEGRHMLSVNRCAWSPDGFKLGVAFSIHIVQTFSYSLTRLQLNLELEAHVGGVNDIVFVNPKKKPCILTCGDDKKIKIWDAITGEKYHTFKGHEAPIFYSISTDGKMKAWSYDSFAYIANYDTSGLQYRRLACGADETRIFGGITSDQGACQIVELSPTGSIKRTYLDCTNAPEAASILQSFETIRNRFLAVGYGRQIKFWDMDNENMLSCTVLSTYHLNATPQVRVNKVGSLLSATLSGGDCIILANVDAQSKFKMRKSISRKGDHDLSEQGNGQATMESTDGQAPQDDEVSPS